MLIENNVLKHYLRNVYFITGTAYAGKSTMVKLLAEKHGMTFCGENYHDEPARACKTPARQPALCYFDTMSGWPEFLNRTPEAYAEWIRRCSEEAAQIEVAELIRLSASGKKIVADTNIPLETLREISDYRHVAVMLSPQSLSAERFFDRDDPEKQFLLRQIQQCEDPEATMRNFRACVAEINSPSEYARYANSGFFTLTRENAEDETRAQTLTALEKHFGLESRSDCYCGHECGSCVTYLATIRDDEAMREQARSYYKSEFGVELPIEQVRCYGGRSAQTLSLCADCPWMACGKRQGVDSCADCERPCDALIQYRAKYANRANQAGVFDEFRRRFAGVSFEAVEKGWSCDKKYKLTRPDGESYLLRVSPAEKHDARVKMFEMMRRASELGVPMSPPVECGSCDEGAYTLLGWIEGEEAEAFVPSLPRTLRYAYGVDAGKILKTIHSLPAPDAREDWQTRFNRKIDRKIKMYTECELQYEGGQAFLDCIAEYRSLLADRPQCFQHGDYHIGNMMVDAGGKLQILDFDRCDYGDPWEEFNRIVWCAQASPVFASGMVDGYFGGRPPMEFWQLLALYISSNTLSSLPWAIPFGQDEVDTMRRQASDILSWYDDMRNPVPAWYSVCV